MTINPFATIVETVDTSPIVSDEIKTTTCYMCACRCGIKVHLKNNQIRYIEGNPEHPVNKGVLCAKGSSGAMQHLSPSRLKKPQLRTGPRGSGEYKDIEWDEALELAVKWLSDVRNDDPKKLAFFTGRDQSQSLTGWWATQFGTPNHAAHGGFCSVNMAAAGLYTIGGSFWEFGEPDWEHTKYFMMFGVAEDHDSNPLKAGIGKIKTKGDAKFVSVNPIRTGYSAVADEWIGLRPGTDGLFIGAIIQELLKAGKVDFDYLKNYTNAAWLVIDKPGDAEHGLFARDDDNQVLKRAFGKLTGSEQLADGRNARPAFELLVERFLCDEYKPENAAEKTGISAATICRIAAELAEAAFEKTVELDIPWTDWTGKQHDKMVGRPVSIHAMRGISAHSNGFHTCRMLHILQMLLGSIDVPGGMRYKAPFPKPIPPGPLPQGNSAANTPLAGPPIGNPKCPADLLVDKDGKPKRIDKAYSWENPLSIHGAMHMVLHNAWKGDPYKIDVLFMYMANMAWNSSMNTEGTLKYLTDKDPDTGEYKIKHFIYSDAYQSETVSYADLILPDTTYLERWDCISLLDRPISSAEGPADSIRQPVVKPDRDVRPFQDVLLDLGVRLGLNGMVNEDMSAKYPEGYKDYLVGHERLPGIGPLAGWRGENGSKQGRGEPNKDQLQKYIDNGCFWKFDLPEDQLYFKHVNKNYLEYSHSMGWIPNTDPIILQIYDETIQKFRLAAEGHGDIHPPEEMKQRVQTYFDPLPFWYSPFEQEAVDNDKYTLSALTQRPAHMYHSWGSMNSWLRQITSHNFLYIHQEKADELDLLDGDWVWIESHHSKVKAPIKIMTGVNKDTVWTWNAIGKRRGSWALSDDAPESKKGFLLNHIISDLLPPKEGGYRYSNSDPVTGQAAWYDLRVSIKKCSDDEDEVTSPYYEKSGPGNDNLPAVQRYTGGKE
ncbi:MAG: formate dehydrogenase [Gammaproteobacteria bacterium]|nr:MAG: formate dehydrogenase [Gammaproteobacteria bacterium]